MRRLTRTLALSALPLVLLMSAGHAGATHLAGGYYHYTISGCPFSLDRRTDPVVNMFTRDATNYNTNVHVNHHTGWTPTDLGTTQYFQVQSSCAAMDSQRASSFSSRFHIRTRQSPYFDFTYGTVTMGTPHHEDLVLCPEPNHAVDANGSSGSGWDQGRATIYQTFVGTHHSFGGSADWGNTQPFDQCDGDVASSNGLVGFWQILA